MICIWCGENFIINEAGGFSDGWIQCPNCFGVNSITVENLIVSEQPIIVSESLPVLEKGSLVKFVNKQHPWFGEIALICERKHKFYRIEVNGSKLLVPEHWVEEIDE